MNKYRVDVSTSLRVPCGMNSIRYIGRCWKTANKVFESTRIGMDAWGKDNPSYGVVLTVWDSVKREYIPKRVKNI